ncbi:MAG: hypothetical protein GF410_09930 [Chitinivibrionales bacterium]|nr:hypothetical protein [Chitinivibrionales bacterium]
MPTGIAGRYPGAGRIDLSGQSLRDAVGYIVAPFGDSVSGISLDNAWERHWSTLSAGVESSAAPDIKNLSVVFALLTEMRYTVFSLEPFTCDALQALSGLSVVVIAAVLHFPKRDVNPFSQADLGVQSFALISPRSKDIALHVVTTTTAQGELCAVRLHDGLVLQGGSRESLVGPVFPSSGGDGPSEYCQIVGNFAVTRLPRFEIEAHIEEWFARVPYTQATPSVVPVGQ